MFSGLASIFSTLVGVAVGALAGMSRGPLDAFLMWVSDLFLSLPQLPLLLLVIYVFVSIATVAFAGTGDKGIGLGNESRGNHSRWEALPGSQIRGSPTQDRQAQNQSTRCSRGVSVPSVRCMTVSSSRAAGSISTPSSSAVSRTAPCRAASPGSTCPAAPATQNPSMYPV